MTIEERFSKGIVVEENEEHIYTLELWGGSTKHPDSIFFYDRWKEVSGLKMFEDKYQVYQWLLYCASQLTFPFYAKELVDFANEEWYNWNED